MSKYIVVSSENSSLIVMHNQESVDRCLDVSCFKETTYVSCSSKASPWKGLLLVCQFGNSSFEPVLCPNELNLAH